ncbi:MAG: pilus assembly protein TadG-related protein [Acidimicrobiaceae bacterium]|nr:pilus assembly protein TadG-related protein [Acidimicrobiaceae bacterium]MCY4175116.1 pilus assembly protein TadG-related protein [Acidimicrobiaceae bacterium]MCY4280017.1 pilus assembly protein TadG-related protein [Acidimicrobiaceae bacterium]MCY4294526.1 pilus assembly protein TadG-related protein [Acidimicrobiaceae bacterium]
MPSGLPRSDAGQAAPLMVVMLAAVALTVLAATEIAQLLDSSAQARTAADAAALAGAAEGRSSAAAVAAANGGVLLDYSEQRASVDQSSGDEDAEVVLVTVEVRVGSAIQTARAERRATWTAAS